MHRYSYCNLNNFNIYIIVRRLKILQITAINSIDERHCGGDLVPHQWNPLDIKTTLC